MAERALVDPLQFCHSPDPHRPRSVRDWMLQLVPVARRLPPPDTRWSWSDGFCIASPLTGADSAPASHRNDGRQSLASFRPTLAKLQPTPAVACRRLWSWSDGSYCRPMVRRAERGLVVLGWRGLRVPVATLPDCEGVRRSHVLLRRNRRTSPNPVDHLTVP